MSASLIDLRSDTVTRPSADMLSAMTAAPVGDDVFGEDPTVKLLEEKTARLLGTEDSLFVPSGTMSNQIAVKLHTKPGDEMLCESTCHMYVWEAGGPAALSGVSCRLIDGSFGILTVDQLRDKVRPRADYYVRTRMVSIENTHNRGGGTIYPLSTVQAIGAWAAEHGLARHLDGARLWNAHIATGISLSDWCDPFDTVSVCFSKGLGAPVGSALAGPKSLIAEARRIRKLLGGGMRQVGILAAACIFAIDHHLSGLEADHRHAQWIADAVRRSRHLRLVPDKVETNLVWFEIDPVWMTADSFAARLREHGVVVHAAGPTTLRACTHRDVNANQAAYAAEIIGKVSAGA